MLIIILVLLHLASILASYYDDTTFQVEGNIVQPSSTINIFYYIRIIIILIDILNVVLVHYLCHKIINSDSYSNTSDIYLVIIPMVYSVVFISSITLSILRCNNYQHLFKCISIHPCQDIISKLTDKAYIITDLTSHLIQLLQIIVMRLLE